MSSSFARVTATVFLIACDVRADPLLTPFEAVEPHMGTLVRIKLYAKDIDVAQTAFRAAFDRVSRLDDTLSDYKPDSELNRLSKSAVRHWVPISDDLIRVLDASQLLATQTDGAFDVTLGPVTHLWRLARQQNRNSDAASLHEALSRCGYRKLHLRDAGRMAMLDGPGMQLDVGGIAKGYAADEALAVLRKLGISSALVAISGDLVFGDAPPGKPGWMIGIDALNDANQPFTQTLTLTNAAVSTSGDSEQHFDAGGVRYSHVLDPRTGLGLTDSLAVTVVARTGLIADGADTAIDVLGERRGLAFAQQNGIAALLVSRSSKPTRTIESEQFALLPHKSSGGF